GAHQLIIVGREAGVQLGIVTIKPYALGPPAPGSLVGTLITLQPDHPTSAMNPVMIVSPSPLSFGSVAANRTVTNTIVVQNGGGGTLAGAASVSDPFRIASGGTYSLGSNQSQ